MKRRFLLQLQPPERGRQWTFPCSPSMRDHSVVTCVVGHVEHASFPLLCKAGEGEKLAYMIVEG